VVPGALAARDGVPPGDRDEPAARGRGGDGVAVGGEFWGDEIVFVITGKVREESFQVRRVRTHRR